MLSSNNERGLFDRSQTRSREQLPEIPASCSWHPRFIPQTGIEFARGPPEDAQRPLITRVVPDTRRDHALRFAEASEDDEHPAELALRLAAEAAKADLIRAQAAKTQVETERLMKEPIATQPAPVSA